MAPLGAFRLLLAMTLFLTRAGAGCLAVVEDDGAKAEADCPSHQAATVFMMQSKMRFMTDVVLPDPKHSGVAAYGEVHRFNHSRRSDRKAHSFSPSIGPSRSDYWVRGPVGHDDVFGAYRTPKEIDFEVAGLAKDKWVLALLEVLALGFFGVDRCYMGQVCAGIVKGCTLGGLGVWFFLDYIVITITCLSRSAFINALAYHADFADGPAGINGAFIMASLSVCIFPIIFTAAAVAALHAYTAKPLPVAELDKQKAAAAGGGQAASAQEDPAAAALLQDGSTNGTDAEAMEGQLQVVVETEEEKEERRNKVKEARLAEFGEAVPFFKLLSLASNFELCLFYFGIVGSVGQGIFQPMLLIFVGRLLDGLTGEIEEQFLHRISVGAITMAIAGFAMLVSAFAQNFGLTYFVELQVAKMRPLYFRALLHRDIGWYDTHDAMSLPTDLDEDMQSYKLGMGVRLGVSIGTLTQVITSLVIACVSCWQIALVTLASMPLNLVGISCFAAALEHRTDRQAVYSRAAKLVDEVLFGIRTVVSLGAERKVLERYKEAVDEATWGGINIKFKIGIGGGWITGLFIVCMGFAFYVGMLLIVAGEQLSIGRMVAAVYSTIGATTGIGSITPGFFDMYHARKNMTRFFHVIETQGEIQKHLRDERAKCPPILSLELVNVHFAYPAKPDTQVLKDVTLKIEKGQRVGVVGESGSGKSTIMALLERFYDPLYGVVLVNGLNLRQFDVKSYRSQIGYVGQEPVLFSDSVKNNIMLGCEGATMKDVMRVAKYANIDFVDTLPERFETYVGPGGSQFSGGQKQRIAIARALIKGPSLLFFDEATSALDTKSEKVIQKAIDNITTSNELSVTTVTIAHRLCTVRKSDIIYVMRHGEVIEHGSPSFLTSLPDGVYQSLVAAQGLGLGMDDPAHEEETGEPENSVALQVGKGNTEDQRDEEERLRQAVIAKSYSVPMTRLLQFCRPEWWAFIPALLGSAISGLVFPFVGAFLLLEAIIPILDYTEPHEMGKLRSSENRSLMIFLLTAFLKFISIVMQVTFFGVLGENMIGRCRRVLLMHILRQDIGFFDNPANTPASLVKALQVYAFRINELCTNIGENADMVSSLVAGVIIAFYYQWQIAMLMVVLLPVIQLATFVEIKIGFHISAEDDASIKEASHVVADALSVHGARTVHASSAEEIALESYKRIVRARTSLGRAFAGSAIAYGFSKSMTFFVMAVGYWYLGYLMVRGQCTFSDGLRAFLGMVYAGIGAAMALTGLNDLTKAKVAAHDLFEILDKESLINGLEANGDTLTEGSGVGRIEFVHVKFLYPWRQDVPVLRGISFTIEAGQSVGICGPSGGGKSTLFSLLQRFYDPTGGRVLIGASQTPLNQLNVRWWRRQVGFVGQEPLLFDASILDNIMYGVEDPDDEQSKDRLQEVYRMAHLAFVDTQPNGWDTQVGPRGCRLSGGQKQRVAIARALIRNPPLLLFDEATSALDSKSEKMVNQALEEARQGRTSLTIAHRLSTIQDCDLLMVIAEGSVVESGTHKELIELGGVYAKLQAIDARSTSSSSHSIVPCGQVGTTKPH